MTLLGGWIPFKTNINAPLSLVAHEADEMLLFCFTPNFGKTPYPDLTHFFFAHVPNKRLGQPMQQGRIWEYKVFILLSRRGLIAELQEA